MGSDANLTTVVYNDSDGSRTVTNALGVTDTYSFTTLQGIPKITTISRAATKTTAAATENFGYDSNGFTATQTDWNGNKTTFANNLHGSPITINEAVGTAVARTTTLVYDTKWIHLPATVITPGLTTTFTYDSNGEVLTRTLTDATTTTAPYSTKGLARTWTNTWSNHLLASIEAPHTFKTSFGYDGTGAALTSITDPLAHVTKVTSHTGGGLPESIVDPNGVTTTLTYNPRQWLTNSTISGAGGTFTTTFTYDNTGNLTPKRRCRTIPTIANGYDGAHRLIKVNRTPARQLRRSYTPNALSDRHNPPISTRQAELSRPGGTLAPSTIWAARLWILAGRGPNYHFYLRPG